jgi:hypothetical protein
VFDSAGGMVKVFFVLVNALYRGGASMSQRIMRDDADLASQPQTSNLADSRVINFPGIKARQSSPVAEVRRPVLEEILIDYGPRNLLAPFFLWAAEACRMRGVELEFVSMEALVQANRDNSDTWLPLFPAFNPDFGCNNEDAFAIIGRNADGDIVVTQAARFYNMAGSNFFDEMQSLRFCYADVGAREAAGEHCTMTAERAREIEGRVLYSGGGWYRRDYRKKGFFEILPRLSRAYAFTKWNTDVTMTLMTDKVFAGGNAQKAGYKNVDWAVDLKNSPLGDIHAAVLWMDTDYVFADLREYCSQIALTSELGDRLLSEIDAGIENRA